MRVGVNTKIIPYRKVKLEFFNLLLHLVVSILIHLNLNKLPQK